MDHILNLIERARKMDQPTQSTPTENAQIAINYDFSAPGPIYRFNTAKKGRAVYDAMVKAWKLRTDWQTNPFNKKAQPSSLFEVKADMFEGWIDLDRVAAISFVEWPKRDKFIARP